VRSGVFSNGDKHLAHKAQVHYSKIFNKMKGLAELMNVQPENPNGTLRQIEVERAYRPDSVSRFPGPTVIPLGAQLPARSSHLPARSGGPPCPAQSRVACLFGVAPGGVWRAVRVATNAVSSYLTVSPLPGEPKADLHRLATRHRRSVLCATFRRPGSFDLLRLAVNQHPALWSPDLPPAACAASDRPARSKHGFYAFRRTAAALSST
jgi:hypothetical protein